MNDQNETLLDLDNIEDLRLDSINDLPEFVMPPDGIYVFATNTGKISSSKDAEGNLKKRINHTYVICKILQVPNENELLPPLGSLVGENFTFNSKGVEIWKLKIKGIIGAEAIKTMTIKEALDEITQNTYYFVGKTRIKKTVNKDTGKEFENVQIQTIREATDEDLEGAFMIHDDA